MNYVLLCLFVQLLFQANCAGKQASSGISDVSWLFFSSLFKLVISCYFFHRTREDWHHPVNAVQLNPTSLLCKKHTKKICAWTGWTYTQILTFGKINCFFTDVIWNKLLIDLLMMGFSGFTLQIKSMLKDKYKDDIFWTLPEDMISPNF